MVLAPLPYFPPSPQHIHQAFTLSDALTLKPAAPVVRYPLCYIQWRPLSRRPRGWLLPPGNAVSPGFTNTCWSPACLVGPCSPISSAGPSSPAWPLDVDTPQAECRALSLSSLYGLNFSSPAVNSNLVYPTADFNFHFKQNIQHRTLLSLKVSSFLLWKTSKHTQN